MDLIVEARLQNGNAPNRLRNEAPQEDVNVRTCGIHVLRSPTGNGELRMVSRPSP